MSLQLRRSEVDDVKRMVNILEVAGRYTELKRRGSEWRGLCPLHAEKTPSFYVREARQNWVCWGCGERGDVIDLVMRIERCRLPDALRRLGADDLTVAPVPLWKPVRKSHVIPCDGVGCGRRLEVDFADLPFLGAQLHSDWTFRRYTDGDVRGMCQRRAECSWTHR